MTWTIYDPYLELSQRVDYCAETGVFRWKSPKASRSRGAIAGSYNRLGYCFIGRDKTPAHRLAFFILNGRKPLGAIDHINGNPGDNRAVNLRECSDAENQQNRRQSKNNTSGYNGVHWGKQQKRWIASIRVNKRSISLGCFKDKETAYRTYRKAKAQYHPFAPDGCNLPPVQAVLL